MLHIIQKREDYSMKQLRLRKIIQCTIEYCKYYYVHDVMKLQPMLSSKMETALELQCNSCNLDYVHEKKKKINNFNYSQ